MNQLKSDKNLFLPLTGIRAIAAFMVCLFHFNPFTEARFGSVIHNFFNEFHVGVTLFFVLSGFLIAYRYIDIQKIDLKQYFLNRFARIFPVYFILTTIIFFLDFIMDKNILIENFFINYILNISLLKGLFDQFKFTGILQAWSLTVEEMFYLFAPFSFILVRRSKYFLVILPIGFLLLGFGMVGLFRNVSFSGFFQNMEFMVSYTFLGRAFEFFIGIGLARIYLNYKHDHDQLNKRYFFTIFGIINCILCIYWISCFKGTNSYGIRHPFGKLINNLFLPLCGISILYWGLITEKNKLTKLLSSKWMILLGKSSYVFYLIHLMVSKINSNFLFVLTVSCILSTVIYKCIEYPLNKYIRNLYIIK